ncbi:MAG TPA: 16S rRNA (guanine(527)-N(7))-methyltransferase RsmG [Terriglobales bacterium]|nr:16S rRNA (guanine(527)-N(7))-methyltransferase RsmG [Terriglobales bacterium]
MDPGRIQALLNPFLTNAPSVLLNNISIYIDLLLRWNSRVNLTAVRDEESIVTRHFGESLFAARHLFPGDPPPATRYLDLGSGAGFPGLPVKLWAPSLKTTLIESNQKKATFLREVIRALVINDANVFASRAEDFPAASAGLVTLRAVERFDRALPLAARLLHPEGRLALLIGSTQLDPARKSLPGFDWQTPLPVPMSASRILLIGHHK